MREFSTNPATENALTTRELTEDQAYSGGFEYRVYWKHGDRTYGHPYSTILRMLDEDSEGIERVERRAVGPWQSIFQSRLAAHGSAHNHERGQ